MSLTQLGTLLGRPHWLQLGTRTESSGGIHPWCTSPRLPGRHMNAPGLLHTHTQTHTQTHKHTHTHTHTHGHTHTQPTHTDTHAPICKYKHDLTLPAIYANFVNIYILIHMSLCNTPVSIHTTPHIYT